MGVRLTDIMTSARSGSARAYITFILSFKGTFRVSIFNRSGSIERSTLAATNREPTDRATSLFSASADLVASCLKHFRNIPKSRFAAGEYCSDLKNRVLRVAIASIAAGKHSLIVHEKHTRCGANFLVSVRSSSGEMPLRTIFDCQPRMTQKLQHHE